MEGKQLTVSRVFVAHPVLVPTDAGMRWKFDIERIHRDYGELITLLDNPRIVLTPTVAHRTIRTALRHYRFAPARDFFLAGGDMTVYALMILAATMDYSATPRQLRYSNKLRDYDIVPMMLFDEEDVPT